MRFKNIFPKLPLTIFFVIIKIKIILLFKPTLVFDLSPPHFRLCYLISGYFILNVLIHHKTSTDMFCCVTKQNIKKIVDQRQF